MKVGAVGLVLLAGCATTVVESEDAPADLSTTVVTVDVAGPTDELLAQLDVELQALSERIIAGDGDDEALARIEALWAALQPELEAQPRLVAGFQAVVDLAGSAVARRRPADADKARVNAEALIAAASGS